jgi:hypothetical protein
MSNVDGFCDYIMSQFKMTDLGSVGHYLGVKFQKSGDGFFMSQPDYISQTLAKYNLQDIHPKFTPLDSTKKLYPREGSTATAYFRTRFMSMVGSLNWLQNKTRPDIAYALSLVSRFMSNPSDDHMEAVLHIFAYLKHTSNLGIPMKRGSATDLLIKGFVDADWAMDQTNFASTTGYVFTIADCPISWSSKKQHTIAHSSTEAEYVAASEASREATWIRNIFNELMSLIGLPSHGAVPLHIDNNSAIKLTKNPEGHQRTKHIAVKHHYIRQCVAEGTLKPIWISGKENPADVLTKALPRSVFEPLIRKIGLRDSPASSEGENAI